MDHSDRSEELVTRYENTLFRTALAILGDVPEAEDAVQDTFVRYLEKRPVFRDADHERAWLLKVTANGCKSRLRARREVLEAVLALPPKQRAAVHLHYYEGYSTEEIAAILGQRPGTVRSHLSRARQALREQLEGEI